MTSPVGREILFDVSAARCEFLEALAHIPIEQAGVPLAPGEWSAWDVVAHLPEVDYFYLQQALTARNVPGSAFQYFDDNWWKRQRSTLIGEPPLGALLDTLAASHRAVLVVLEGLSDLDLSRPAAHPRAIPYTVADIFRRLAAHDRTHAQQLARPHSN